MIRCTVCDDYDLCERCESRGESSKEHDRNHPMERIPPGSKDAELLSKKKFRILKIIKSISPTKRKQ